MDKTSSRLLIGFPDDASNIGSRVFAGYFQQAHFMSIVGVGKSGVY